MYVHILVPHINEPCIVIFDQKDDDVLLKTAILYSKNGMNPRIVDYVPDLGMSITVYDLSKMLGTEYEQLD